MTRHTGESRRSRFGGADIQELWAADAHICPCLERGSSSPATHFFVETTSFSTFSDGHLKSKC
jgi:hypothetical protein